MRGGWSRDHSAAVWVTAAHVITMPHRFPSPLTILYSLIVQIWMAAMKVLTEVKNAIATTFPWAEMGQAAL
ncbi:hypothetical protein CEXT_25581 [Caerostris extrusa]|uniref:Uncharacterized protein n=1 Tax=Caerostris extrusa TaxID=172846 RepID=A0AAV4Y511_CAEEX|nr:hypothetical protein CEXT_25581 [Caerostris extrusa]